MGENSNIEWTDHTFNIAEGCTKVSPACTNCYAERRDKQYHGGEHWGVGSRRRTMSESYWRQPLKWNAKAKAKGLRPRVFCSSLADVFEDHPDLVEPRRRLFQLITATPHLDWLLLTKRPENIEALTYTALDPFGTEADEYGEPHVLSVASFDEAYPNVWMGVTVENQEYADKRIPALLKIPAKVRFLSIEPMLGEIDLERIPIIENLPTGSTVITSSVHRIDWVIAGGESGPNARPSHPDWFRSLREQCQAADVAFHFKQWGEWSEETDRSTLRVYNSGEYETIWPDGKLGSGSADQNGGAGCCMIRVGKKNAGRLLDGRTWDELPHRKVGL